MHNDVLFFDLHELLYINHRQATNDHIDVNHFHLVDLNRQCFPVKEKGIWFCFNPLKPERMEEVDTNSNFLYDIHMFRITFHFINKLRNIDHCFFGTFQSTIVFMCL